MNTDKFTEIFAEDIVMVDLEDIAPNTELAELEDWDSMAIISLNATLDEYYGFTLNQEEIKKLTLFSDILNYINEKSTK